MNYLAHAALSYQYPEITIGNLIGEHIRGRHFDHLPNDIALGVQLHRQIDSVFDNLPAIINLRQEFAQGRRRFSGIIIDFWFDHWLANNWDNQLSNQFDQSLEQFQQTINHWITDHWQWVPDSQKRFLNYLMSQDLFLKYRSMSQITHNVSLVAKRLKRGEKLHECLEQIKTDYKQPPHDVFLEIFSDMQTMTQTYIRHHNAIE